MKRTYPAVAGICVYFVWTFAAGLWLGTGPFTHEPRVMWLATIILIIAITADFHELLKGK